MVKTLNERQLRRLVEQMVDVTDDDANPHKDVHADPTGRNWDAGLDEDNDFGGGKSNKKLGYPYSKGVHTKPLKKAGEDDHGKHIDEADDDEVEPEDDEQSDLANDVAERVGMVFYDMLHYKFPFEELDRAQLRLEDWVRRMVTSLNR